MNLPMQVLLAFIGTIGFSIIFNVGKRELVLCGAAGAAGWLVYQLVIMAWPGSFTSATFFGAMAVTCISRLVANLRRMPATVYMIPGIIPLVPGIGIYYTMFFVVMGDNSEALLWGIHTLRIAGVIAVGLLIVLTLPRRLFMFSKHKI